MLPFFPRIVWRILQRVVRALRAPAGIGLSSRLLHFLPLYVEILISPTGYRQAPLLCCVHVSLRGPPANLLPRRPPCYYPLRAGALSSSGPCSCSCSRSAWRDCLETRLE